MVRGGRVAKRFLERATDWLLRLSGTGFEATVPAGKRRYFHYLYGYRSTPDGKALKIVRLSRGFFLEAYRQLRGGFFFKRGFLKLKHAQGRKVALWLRLMRSRAL